MPLGGPQRPQFFGTPYLRRYGLTYRGTVTRGKGRDTMGHFSHALSQWSGPHRLHDFWDPHSHPYRCHTATTFSVIIKLAEREILTQSVTPVAVAEKFFETNAV